MNTKGKILIVDDDAPFRFILGKTLVGEGYDVKSAADGEEALEIVGKEGFDLIMIDLIMPQKNGFQTIECLMDSHPETNLIAMSGNRNGSSSYLRVAGKIGACLTLAKPFSKQALLEAVETEIAENKGVQPDSPGSRGLAAALPAI